MNFSPSLVNASATLKKSGIKPIKYAIKEFEAAWLLIDTWLTEHSAPAF